MSTWPPAHHVFIKWHDRQTVLIAGESVNGVSEVQLGVDASFGGRHHADLFATFYHPLPLLAVAYHVGLP